MYIGLKNIQHLFASFSTQLINSDGIHCLTGWTKLTDEPRPFTEHLLYVCEYSEKLDLSLFTENIHVLCIVKDGTDFTAVAEKFPSDLSLLLIENPHSTPIYSELQRYFNMQCGIGMFSQTLLDFLASGDDLQPVIEYAFSIFRNPVFLFDPNYNLIAATWEAIEKLNIHDQVVFTKRLGDQDFEMVNRQNNIHNKVRKSEIPIKAYNEFLGYEQMYCAINTQKDLGHIVVSAVNKPFDPIDTEFMLMLKKFVGLQLKKDSFIRTSRGFNYEYFLKELLEKKIAIDSTNTSQMQYVNKEFTGNMYCMVVETARSAFTVNTTHMRNVVESRFPNSKTIIYNSQIIAILSIKTNHLIPSEYLTAAKNICQENGLYAGLSNCFQNIMKFEEYYKQALRAIELGICEINEPGLFWYKDYYLEHVKNIFTQKESSETFCHPKMKFLMDYDREYNSELAYTLYMYLIHERNLTAAAEAMNLHRTSLVYRFKKIQALLGEYFDDYKDRMYLILSYEMSKENQ